MVDGAIGPKVSFWRRRGRTLPAKKSHWRMAASWPPDKIASDRQFVPRITSSIEPLRAARLTWSRTNTEDQPMSTTRSNSRSATDVRRSLKQRRVDCPDAVCSDLGNGRHRALLALRCVLLRASGAVRYAADHVWRRGHRLGLVLMAPALRQGGGPVFPFKVWFPLLVIWAIAQCIVGSR